jgi:riboflavin synthase
VDATGTVTSIQGVSGSLLVGVSLPGEAGRYVVEKGSIAVDGISLTVARVTQDGFEVAIIPHTWEATNLHERSVGERVNIEVDLIAKYVERLLGDSRGK